MNKAVGLDREKFEALSKESWTASKDINRVWRNSPHIGILLLPNYVLDISAYSYKGASWYK